MAVMVTQPAASSLLGSKTIRKNSTGTSFIDSSTAGAMVREAWSRSAPLTAARNVLM